MKIASYPLFTPITLGLKDTFRSYTTAFDPYSDFDFTSLLAWGGASNAECSLLGGNLIIRLPDYLTGQHIYSVLGTTNIDTCLDTLLSRSHKLKLIPEVVIESLGAPALYQLKEDRDNFDYIYQLKDLVTLEGSNNKKYRQKVHSFEAAHKDLKLETRVIKKMHIHELEMVQEVNKLWNRQTQREDDEIRPENRAINRLLLHSNHLNLVTIVVLVDGEPKAFSINEILGKGYSICHFEKALVDHHSSTATYMVYAAAKAMHEESCTYVNWEQDLGIDGLRQSKEFYNPHKMLKKYEITSKKVPIFASQPRTRTHSAAHMVG